MFFALVANDKQLFYQLLQWTENNLAEGNFSRHLPAWLWGRDPEGQWQVLDDNSASDVDLLLIYTLYQASNAWQEPALASAAQAISKQLFSQSVRWFAEHPILLPAPYGFDSSEGITINPSYWPLFVFDGLFNASNDARWKALGQSAEQLMTLTNEAGVAADWLTLDQQYQVQNPTQAVGSYDAIRTYYWFAIDPHRRLLNQFQGFAAASQQQQIVPEEVSWQSGSVIASNGPVGFSALLLPYFKQTAPLLYQQALQRLDDESVDGYYNNVLTLFGVAYQQCFTVNKEGQLDLFWLQQKGCYAN